MVVCTDLYLQEMQQFPRLYKEEEAALIARLQQAQQEASPDTIESIRQRLVEGCLGMSVAIARHYHFRFRRMFTLDDLIQEGNLALLMVSHRFVHSGCDGRPFSPYAWSWIEGTIRGALGLDATVKGCPCILSLDVPLVLDGEQTFADCLAAPVPELPDEEDLEDKRQHVAALLSRLPPRQKEVIQLRYNVESMQGETTNAEAARVLGLNPSVVSQLSRSALVRMATDPRYLHILYGTDTEKRWQWLAEAYQEMVEEGTEITLHALARRTHLSGKTTRALAHDLPHWEGSAEERMEQAIHRLTAQGQAHISTTMLASAAKVRAEMAAEYLASHSESVDARLEIAYQQMCAEGPITLKELMKRAHCGTPPARAFLVEKGFSMGRGKPTSKLAQVPEMCLV